MRNSTRPRIPALFLYLTIAATVAAASLAVAQATGFAAHAARVTPSQSHVSRGTLVPAAQVNPRALPVALSPQSSSSSSTRLKGARAIHAHGSAAASIAPAVASSSLVSGQSSALPANFNGVSSLDSANTNFGQEFEPPDQGLCEGNDFVLEAVNSAFTIYRPNGRVVIGPFNVNDLFNEGALEFTSDPRCYYEASTHTWFAIILFINSNNTAARTDVAVNASGDPTTVWTIYHIDATDNGTNHTPHHPGCPCFGDQPLLGIDQVNVYLSTNEFSILGPQFNGAQIYALDKSQLVAGKKPVAFVHFDNLSIGGAIAASVQPAITNGSANAEYFLNSLDPNGTFDDRVGVWAMTNRDVTHGGTPTLSHLVIMSEAYGVPPPAAQKGASSTLDAGDDRMQQVEYMNGAVWGALDSAVTIPHDPSERAGAAWFEVHPHLSGSSIGGASMVAQGYVALSGNYLLYPAIQVDHAGAGAIVMTLSGANHYPSAVFTRLAAGGTSFGPIHIAAGGTGPYDPQATRWGDYSWAILDPASDTFWMATEYIPPRASQTHDGLRNWGTRVLEVSASG